MLKNIHAIILFTLLLTLTAAAAWAQETEPTASSNLTGARLPANAIRVRQENVPGEITDALAKLVATGEGKVRQGDSEVLAWTGASYKKGNSSRLIQEVQTNLKSGGWTYELGGTRDDVTIFSIWKPAPNGRAAVGFFVPSDDALVLAWTELLPVNSGNVQAVKKSNNDLNNSTTQPRPISNNSGAKVLNVEKTAQYVNVMGNEMPKFPAFQALSPIPGKVRGYVKDINGKPLAGAAIGVRSTLIGGAYSGAQGVTDAKGYYEFLVPKGVAHYYNAGYTIEWGEGLAALSLHPVDGKVDSFASPDGAVENFVLLPYGITSRENVSENPRLSSTYYGGTIYVGHWTREANDEYAPKTNIVQDAVVEITLTPEGEMLGGVPGQSFVVRKPAFSSGFWINNIPIGRYRISAKMENGKPLKIKLNKPTGTVFGMSPTETTGSAVLTFFPDSAKASMVGPNYGSWNSVEIYVENP